MRRWMLTVGLALAAGVAALLAPRLLERATRAQPEVLIVEGMPGIHVDRTIVEAEPPVPPERPAPPRHAGSVIPELSNPIQPAQPTEPIQPVEPELETFWDGCPACGMG